MRNGAGGYAGTSHAAPASAPSAERRLVSVLFADLVGFTTLSEGRDAEDVRELLSRYFETARDVVARYGGNIEKFIGDAVMAVWGTPTAQEDDAERAVRAALDLVEAVPGARTPALRRARAGVLTGEAAVALGAEGRAWWRAISSTPRPASSRGRSPARSSSARRRAARPRPRSPTRMRVSTS